jgi:cysteine synthase A
MVDWQRRSRILSGALEAAGLTPLVRLPRVAPGEQPLICAKLEFLGPSGSVKDRILPYLLAQAEARGDLRPGMTIIEATTGNTGIATSMAAAARGYPCVIVMPEGMSEERKRTIRAYGAELVLTPGGESDVDLAVAKVAELMAAAPGRYWAVGQFVNADNVAAHAATTGPELWEQTEGRVTDFIAAVGTGGTLSGVARALKQRNPAVRIWAVEPAECAILAGDGWGSHRIEGIGDGFVPDTLELDLVDGVVVVHSDEALAVARRLAREEGLFVGISSGCNVAAALKVARHAGAGLVTTVLSDNGLRYLSTELADGPKPEFHAPDRPHDLPPAMAAALAAHRPRWTILR